MKRRLLAFLLAFVMTFSLVPVNTFAAEADAAAHYTNITTESGENVTVEYVETVVGEAAWGQSINTPYYHVTIPEGTEKVLLTYPESVNLVLSGDDGAVFFYRNTYPGQSEINLGGALTFATNDDRSKTVTIPVERFMLSTDGSVAVGMAYYVDEENQSAAEFFDFTYAALTHVVTLTSGEGYTLTGKTTVEDGKDYSFTVTIADDYEMEDNFVVKANGETLTAGESGSYTVENVTDDLTITVEGVVKKQAASHSVILTSGGGYTLKGETTVADGADYTFSLKFDNYYGAGNGFAVKANGTALTAGEDGTYTVKKVTTDLTITVEGVTRLYKVSLPHGWSRQFTMSACDGYADPSTDPRIAKGGDYKFKVTPNVGFAVRDNNYDVSFSGSGDVSVEVKDGCAVVTLTNIYSTGEVKIQGVKEIITVTLPEGEGFTAAAAEGTKTPVLKGDSYSFTVAANEGYDATNMVVKVNGNEVAGTDGSYTVENVSSDLTITVDGVVKKQAASHSVTLTSGEGYTLTGEATAEDGKDYTFKLELDYRYEAGEDFAVQVNGKTVTGEKGVYTVKNVSTNLVITVKGVKEKVLEPVTVYFSFSHDDQFEFCEESGQVMALKKVTVPYFDLGLYGLKDFYFRSENYGSASGDPTGGPGSDLTPGTKEFAYGKITLLHLYIYATEVFYLGVDPADAGKGEMADKIGKDTLNITGKAGSLYMQQIWGYDENLNYYLNYEYPLASTGWGSTSDQILLHDGDIVTLGHFSDWRFYEDSGAVFNHIETDTTNPVQGDKVTMMIYRDGADSSGNYTTAHTVRTNCPDVYCTLADSVTTGDVTKWTKVGTANEDGTLVVDTSTLAPGEYIFAIPGQHGNENTSAIVGAPGGIRLTIHEKPVVKGDINGDGTVDVFDVSALYSAIFSDEELDAAVADVNGDGVVDVFDVSALYALIMYNN